MRIINLILKPDKGSTYKKKKERKKEKKLNAIRLLTIHQNCSYLPTSLAVRCRYMTMFPKWNISESDICHHHTWRIKNFKHKLSCFFPL